MWRGKELQPFPSLYSPFLHFFICQPSIDSLPSTSLRSPSLSTLPSSYLPLLLPFPASTVVPYIPLSLSIFPFPYQPSPSLLFLLPTCLLPYLSTSLPSPFLPFPLPHPSPFFRCYPSPFPLLFSSPFPFISLLPLSSFLFPFHSFPLFLTLSRPLSLPFFLPFPSSSPPLVNCQNCLW